MFEPLNDDNFLIYAARHYDNPQCHSTDEFLEDLKRLKYIKKLLTRYIENKELKERLILNHLIVLNNVFKPPHLCRILYLKMKDYFSYIIPFMIMINIMPDKMYNIRDEKIIDMALIPIDGYIIKQLRKI
jgi:hypothetical protein